MKCNQVYRSNTSPTGFVVSAFTAIFLFAAAPAFAQATRTWVSGVGDDANPCSRTAPCKTFAGAISKTSADGFINAIDPGGFGTVTITKSITIDGDGAHAGILAGGTNGIIINGVGIIVTIRNLSIESDASGSPGINGINVIRAAEVHVENVSISGFSQEAIHFSPTGGGEGYFDNVTITNNAAGGIAVGTGRVLMNNLQADSNGSGVTVTGTATATVRNSHAAGGGVGFGAVTATSFINIENSTATHNQFGVFTFGGATARISNSFIVDNTNWGLRNADGVSFFVSLGGNSLAGNPNQGVFTSAVPKQ